MKQQSGGERIRRQSLLQVPAILQLNTTMYKSNEQNNLLKNSPIPELYPSFIIALSRALATLPNHSSLGMGEGGIYIDYLSRFFVFSTNSSNSS